MCWWLLFCVTTLFTVTPLELLTGPWSQVKHFCEVPHLLVSLNDHCSAEHPDEQPTVTILPGFVVWGFFSPYDNRYQILKVFSASAMVTGGRPQGRGMKCQFSMPWWTRELGLLQNDNMLPPRRPRAVWPCVSSIQICHHAEMLFSLHKRPI